MTFRPKAFAPALALLALLGTGGCYSYTPVQTPAPGTVVRVHVPLTSAVSNPNRPPETVDVEGTVISAGDTLVLATETRRELGTFRVLTDSDTLRMAVTGLAGMEERSFSSAKTYGLSALVVAGAAGLILAAIDAGGGSRGDSGPGGPNTSGAIKLPPLIFKHLLWGILR